MPKKRSKEEVDDVIRIGRIEFKPREIEAMELLSKGKSHAYIAQELGVSESTVDKMFSYTKSYLSLPQKIGVGTSYEVLSWYKDHRNELRNDTAQISISWISSHQIEFISIIILSLLFLTL